MLPLRAYQTECLSSIKKLHAQGKHRQIVSLPTASGKTVIFANLIKETGCRTLVIANTLELLDQAKNKINMICPNLKVGLIDADHKEFNAPVVVSSIQSAMQADVLEELARQNFELLIYDESHHSATESARKVLGRLGFGKGTEKLLVGFTATAFRNDGKGLGEVFDVIVFERNIKYMLTEGWLCPIKAFKIKTDLDLSKVETAEGDFQSTSLDKVMNTAEMNALVVDAYIKNGAERQALVFAVNVMHAMNLVAIFQAKGIRAAVVYGDMPKKERIERLDAYKAGTIKVLCNVQVLTEGFDSPETSCVIIARPTKSRGLYQQVVGRGLRLYPNKIDCIVLDFGDVNHSICNSATLYSDFNLDQDKKKRSADKKSLLAQWPKLDPKLQAAIVSLDLLGQAFYWEKDGRSFIMRGSNNICLAVRPMGQQKEDKYCVNFSTPLDHQTLAKDLSFDYAFAVAEDFAKKHRRYFIINDLEAKWRKQPISENQIKIFKSKGYRKGIKHLTKGQASLIIGSGVFRDSSNF